MPRFLKNLCTGRGYQWHSKAPRGRSGGILLGVDLQLCNKSNNFKWALVVVYGPTQDEHKESFLAELVNMCSHENLPLVMGGDYNILRHSSEKNNDH
jgi:hypothetical protein